MFIHHGADIAALDGVGRSAIQLVKANVRGPHPRTPRFLYSFLWYYRPCEYQYNTGQDIEMLDVLKRAFNHKFQGTISFEDYEDVSPAMIDIPSARQESRATILERLRFIFMLHITRKHWYHKLCDLWKLPFHEALLMRFFYVLSYFLILATEGLAFAIGAKSFPKTSRSILSAVAVLVLVLIWGYWRDE